MRQTAIRSAAALAAVATLFASSSAFALKTPAGMGTEGSLTVTADRLFGFLWQSTYTESTQGPVKTETTQRRSDIILGTGKSGAAGPRIGLDYTVIPNLTIGAAFGLGYTSVTGKQKVSGGGQTVETTSEPPGATTIFIAPRVGYLIDFSDNFGIWPRAGVTIARTSSTDERVNAQGATVETENSEFGLWATIEAPLVISPADHFAFTAGPFLDFPLTSSQKSKTGGTTVELDPAPKTTFLGVGIGMLGSF